MNEVQIVLIDGRGTDRYAGPILDAVYVAMRSNPSFKEPILITPRRDNCLKWGTMYEIPAPLSYAQYNELVFGGLLKSLQRPDWSHILLMQTDGHVCNPHSWNPSWLHFDYIGAPWPPQLVPEKFGKSWVGNGGFSLRSRKLMEACATLEWPASEDWPSPPEDVAICQYYRYRLEEMGIKFAPPEVAAAFSLENETRWTPARGINDVFGFHGFDFNRTRDAMRFRLGT